MAVAEFLLRAPDHGNFFIATSSVEFHYPKYFRKLNVNYNIEKKGPKWKQEPFAQKTIAVQDSMTRDHFFGQCARGRK